MCKLLLGVKNPGKNDDFANAIKAQFDVMSKESHGIGAFVKTKDGGVSYMRNLEDYDAVYSWVVKNLDSAELVGIHTRTMSTGKICLRNCHFFDVDGYLFAHNGFARKYGTKSYISSSSSSLGFSSREGKVWNPKEIFGKNIPIGTTHEYEEAKAKMKRCAGCQIAYKGYCKTHKSLAKIVRRFETGNAADIPDNDDDTTIIIPQQDVISEDPKIVSAAVERELALIEKEKKELGEDEGWDVVDGKVSLTDSELFIRALKKPFTLSDIRHHVFEGDFTGMGVLVEGKTGETYLLAYKKCYVLKGESFSIFCSWDPEEDYTNAKYGQTCGVLYEEGEESVPLAVEKFDIIEGTYAIKPETLK